ncbi:DUF6907 domain-containing protein [Nocardia cyriacigeorgica]|uniref:DUF6907 domain-containing protein n=1 Tax=Nocardia cyriacigeorgica TaxID=135487 RepID=UPI00267CEADC
MNDITPPRPSTCAPWCVNAAGWSDGPKAHVCYGEGMAFLELSLEPGELGDDHGDPCISPATASVAPCRPARSAPRVSLGLMLATPEYADVEVHLSTDEARRLAAELTKAADVIKGAWS